MSTRAQDQSLVAEAAEAHPGKVIPAFGWHPWFSYQLYDESLDFPHLSQGNDELTHKKAHLEAALSPAPTDSFIRSTPLLQPLGEFCAQLRQHLEEYPNAMVGEVGLDRAFRLPRPLAEDEERSSEWDEYTPGGREGRLLSPHRVNLPHQVTILKAQLGVAAEYGRAASVHGVQAHGALFEAVSSLWKGHERHVVSRRERRAVAENAEGWEGSSEDEEEEEKGKEKRKLPYPPRICLHSFSGPAEILRQWFDPKVPAKVFCSFSTAVNFGAARGGEKTREAVLACPDDRVLVESDLHVAGERMDKALEDVYRRVCEIKGWELEEGVRRIAANFREFVHGDRSERKV